MMKKIFLFITVTNFFMFAFDFGLIKIGADATKTALLEGGANGSLPAETGLVIGYEHKYFGIEHVLETQMGSESKGSITSIFGQYLHPISEDVDIFFRLGLSKPEIDLDNFQNNCTTSEFYQYLYNYLDVADAYTGNMGYHYPDDYSPSCDSKIDDNGKLYGLGMNINNRFQISYTTHRLILEETAASIMIEYYNFYGPNSSPFEGELAFPKIENDVSIDRITFSFLF